MQTFHTSCQYGIPSIHPSIHPTHPSIFSTLLLLRGVPETPLWLAQYSWLDYRLWLGYSLNEHSDTELLKTDCHGTWQETMSNNYWNTPSGSYGHLVHPGDKSHINREAGFKQDWVRGAIDLHRVANWNITDKQKSDIWFYSCLFVVDRKPVRLTNVCHGNACT